MYHLIKRKAGGKIVYYARFVDEERTKAHGKTVYRLTKSTGETSKTRARTIADSMEREGVIFASPEALDTFLIDFWTPGKSEYLKSKEAEEGRTISVGYCYSNRKNIAKYFLPFIEARGIRTLRDLTPAVLESWRNSMAGQDAPVSKVTANKVRQAVWVALGYASDLGMIPTHPGVKVKRIKDTAEKAKARIVREGNILEIAEAHILFDRKYWKSNYSDDLVSWAAAIFCFATGARISEARGLRFKNLNLDLGMVDIVDNWQDGERLKVPKWNSIRRGLPLPDPAIDAINKLVKTYRWPKRTGEDFVFFNLKDRAKPINKATLNASLKRALARSGIERAIRFHDLRHSWASHSAGLPQAVRMYQLGHKRPEMTEEVYTHITEAGRDSLRIFGQNLLTKPIELETKDSKPL